MSFQIAFVGTIRAGESTLISAMLEKDYASVDVIPETAVLTTFKYGPKPLITIGFYTAQECKQFLANMQESKDNSLREYEEFNAGQEGQR
ncbi:hypothetical protein [Helicobacter ailurogastricus]|uniref:hypothetical protein n=1 Tax=Helicobacter ailurogastricus TaxID=1578720 RepID=UPI000CF18770|nr:hypothetical protein [Helicobacter ailurogastricus]GLH58069.1 hypothetical protein NHP214376_08580 [Helicobacter ailurogastricus]GLH59312.1 hypothetical protein NHP214377_05790 [Helicobacter ailurogastricus]GMB89986.1 hypothetical protein NHP190002_06670 [Helicobacter ailurogastricus]